MEEINTANIQAVKDSHAVLYKMLTVLEEPADKSFQGGTAPAIIAGMEQLEKNSDTADKSTKGLVKPDEVAKSFADSAEFHGEIARFFPELSNRIGELKKELKGHHFDLANLIHDVSTHARSTHDNVERCQRKLFLRQKYSDQLTAVNDFKIWQYEVRTLTADLKYSAEKLMPIIEAI